MKHLSKDPEAPPPFILRRHWHCNSGAKAPCTGHLCQKGLICGVWGSHLKARKDSLKVLHDCGCEATLICEARDVKFNPVRRQRQPQRPVASEEIHLQCETVSSYITSDLSILQKNVAICYCRYCYILLSMRCYFRSYIYTYFECGFLQNPRNQFVDTSKSRDCKSLGSLTCAISTAPVPRSLSKKSSDTAFD